ncbi:MAG: restriction endonuclease subunit S [Treponema sp.]|nr:restriction endonuclease subunit S [Treponema sp.]
MSEWKKVKIGDFLTEREGRYKPDDTAIAKYQRLDKIDFSGTIHLSNKPTKTDMILVQPGDLVISGINVAKGALTVYQGNEPVCATIHYSAYTFDSSIVNLDYFKYFVKSPAFLEVLKQQVKGGIKTEIKPKHLLPLEIAIPDLPTQNKIVSEVSEKLCKAEQIAAEIEAQKEYAKQLRQNILQEAIESKLTADWREAHKTGKNADELLKELSSKVVDKKLKNLHTISETEKPFEIPSSWKWCRLGEIIESAPRNGYSPKAVDFETPYKTLKLGAVTYGYFDSNEYKYIDEEIASDSYCWLKNGDFLIERSNSLEYVGICAIYTGNDNEFLYPDLLMKFRVSAPILKEYVHKALIAQFNRAYFMSNAKGAQKTMPKINQDCVINAMIPLPPLAEQKEIVARVEAKLQTVTALEAQISEREELTKQLMQSILKEAFEEG